MVDNVNNPMFARFWTVMSSHESEALRRLRRENLAGLSGRVLEIGAGTGSNFALYPASVRSVVAVEPEPRLAALARRAATNAPVPVSVTPGTVEQYSSAEPFDAVVCSLVLCSVQDPQTVLRQVYSLLRPGGELRYLEHVASTGWRARLQKIADATLWPRVSGNCHTHRHTEQTIRRIGFRVDDARHEWMLPAWAPLPVSEMAIGLAVRPA
jgi:SAM-dependent methyltransferase